MTKIGIDGEVFEYDQARMLNTEAIQIQKFTGLGMTDWFKAMGAMDPTALTALVWLIYKRDGRETAFSDVEFDIGSFEFISDDPPEEEPDPPNAAEPDSDAALT